MKVNTLKLQNQTRGTFRGTTLWMSLCLLLTGCSTYQETFECEPGQGIGCKSIDKIDVIKDDGEERSKQQSLSPALNSMQSPAFVEGLDGPKRIQEEQVRVWIAPFQDDQGNLHESSVIYTVVRPGYWQLSDLMRG